MRNFVQTEHDIQSTLIAWADLVSLNEFPELAFLFAIPNGAKLPYLKKGNSRWSPEASRLLNEGMKPGVPDLCLPVPRGRYHGLFLEMKREDGKVRPDQEKWIAVLRSQGYFADIAWSFEQAQGILVQYLSLPVNQCRENGNE